MDQPSENLERIPLPEGRKSNAAALQQLEQATGLSSAHLRGQIPELDKEHLAFGIRWASDGFDDSEVGRYNADAVRDFVVLHIPILSVDGNVKNDLSGVNTSHHINTVTGEVKGFSGFYDAEEDLAKHYATARVGQPSS